MPVVLGLVILAMALPPGGSPVEGTLGQLLSFDGEKFWGAAHGCLLLLAAVGVCVGFIASIMYLVQVGRLRAKVAPDQGMRLMSLERLEVMNRRAILWSFPLLTAGLLVGMALQWQQGDLLEGWDSPKIVSALGLWLVFAILLYLRYAAHVRGRQTAFLTVVAFALLLFALVSPVHPFVQGGGP
jgi:ABC-type transport system involved in cytochrome c biogenesis permease subunit